jgi:hypothetical protein
LFIRDWGGGVESGLLVAAGQWLEHAGGIPEPPDEDENDSDSA